jgi:hypothetical protein
MGSGVRAASAIARHADVTLHTVIGAAEREELLDFSAQRGFSLDAIAGDRTVSFDYVHPLSDPRISPRLDAINRRRITVEGEMVLVYGMLDADVVVNGGTVVYDPQSPHAPTGFRRDGSSATRLAFLGNTREIMRLANASDLDYAAEFVRSEQDVEVLIVKMGLRGCRVYCESGVSHVPAYRSSLSWTIGSGDLFAAAFCYFWGLHGLDAPRAADGASRAVAVYAQYRSVPVISDELFANPNLHAVRVQEGRVYLAGPFFNLQQRWMIEEARAAFRRAGFEVASPLHDVGVVGTPDEIANKDLKLLEGCDRVFALVDDGDIGTIFEVGWARRHRLPVIAFGQRISQEDRKMLVGTGCEIVEDFASAVAATVTL